MTKDEALKLALDDLIAEYHMETSSFAKRVDEIFKQALAAPVQRCALCNYQHGHAIGCKNNPVDIALDKMAENARELGLDYEPVLDVSLIDEGKTAAPVQEPVGLIDRLKNPEQHYEFTDPKKANAVLMSLCQEAADALAAQRQWVGLTDDEMYLNCPNWLSHEQCKAWLTQIEAKLKDKNAAAQPAVPDAMHHTDMSKTLEYIQGWNDCRQAMMETMK
jgi:hypothetical protein